jgi:hypothetical protein
MTWEQIRTHGIEWYRGQGIDMTDLNRRFAGGGIH